MISMKLKDAIKLDSARLDKTYPEEKVLSEDFFTEIYINMETKKDMLQT